MVENILSEAETAKMLISRKNKATISHEKKLLCAAKKLMV